MQDYFRCASAATQDHACGIARPKPETIIPSNIIRVKLPEAPIGQQLPQEGATKSGD
jgi:hypothetical protein